MNEVVEWYDTKERWGCKPVNSLIDDIQRLLGGILYTLVLITILVPSVGFIAGYLSGIETVPENTRLFLSALAGAQAGILAIVFSVTVIGIQLIATRYSPRMISLFTDSPIFIYTFGLFVLSIAVDLCLLLIVPETSYRMYTAGIGVASGLGLTTVIALFVFVKTAIKQSTPDGAIDAFVSGMSTDRYLKEVKESVENDSETAHPMHPLYNLTMNALSSDERVTAEKGLQEYGDIVENTLFELKEREIFSEEERQVLRELFDPVFKEHLHDISLHAEEKDENQVVSTAVELQYNLGNDGLDISDDIVSQQAQFGISGIIRDAPVETGSLISSNVAWEHLGKLLLDASEKPRPGVVWSILSSIETGVSRQLWKVSDVGWYTYSMTDLYRYMGQSHEVLLDHYGDDIAQVEMEWQYEHVPDDAPNREGVNSVYAWRKALFATTGAFLRYVNEEGRYPIAEGNLKKAWKKVCIEASESPAEDYAVTLCQALIEVTLFSKLELDQKGISWDSCIGRVMHEGNREIVDQAFERILRYDYKKEKPEPLGAGEMEERRQEYYQNQLRIQDFPPVNTILKFEEIVESIQKRANDRCESLNE
ncbi:DUF2254 domain-containing protein [Halovenus sp. WSH3]|uniref:DUF2254 domain-containing protein n=1 Tax=Halovenus carboxidivorans TaxID=2692199 RepID=A0A6B0TBW3_9EURY|nr:DUF2254 family protein [Halovenus carboxidivorans]MXR52390.1 DUF2254 domain-containing protein [Halovenus carboxidivorans]